MPSQTERGLFVLTRTMSRSWKTRCCQSTQLDTEELQESDVSESMQPVPTARNKNIIKKKGFKYGLVEIDHVKGRRFGLGIKTHKDQVVVSKSQKDSICDNIVKRLDRIIDVNGTQVADRDVCREMLVKSLQRTGTVNLVIERPVEKEAIEAMEKFLAEAGGQSAATSPVRDMNTKSKPVEPNHLLKELRNSSFKKTDRSKRKSSDSGKQSGPPSSEDLDNLREVCKVAAQRHLISSEYVNAKTRRSPSDSPKKGKMELPSFNILKKGSKLKANFAENCPKAQVKIHG
ncbi:unnamed protein product [Strongylus vulgaris]|uniref:PDZ domain-containing protein n=1 Tax=Strongylus vulgaris TaxID=40348 RepID=A0A3P7KDZ2_STRVU|nr:unnamed protein product [Strongylus vulgaris]